MSDLKLTELDVVGVTRSQIQAGAYALILGEHNGSRRLPIVIGASEAQSIAVKLEGIIPPRPLTHDLMQSVFHAFHIELACIVITGYKDGVFSSELHLTGDDVDVKLDSRTSDAIAMAIRTNARIYATNEVMDVASYDSEEAEAHSVKQTQSLEHISTSRLRMRMQHHVEREEYEEAARIQKILESRSDE